MHRLGHYDPRCLPGAIALLVSGCLLCPLPAGEPAPAAEPAQAPEAAAAPSAAAHSTGASAGAPSAVAPGAAAPSADTAVAAPQAKEPESWPSAFLKSLTFSGYLEASYTWNTANARPSSGPENRGRVFDVNSNEFMLNGFLLDIERPANEDTLIGFKVTPFAGQDAELTQSFGLFKHLQSTPVDTDGDGQFDSFSESEVSDTSFDLLNAYIQGYVPQTGTKIQLGKWETTAGAEVIRGPANDNFSRSYLFGFAVPYTHTGILMTQPVFKRSAGSADLLAVAAGVSNGWDNVDDRNDAKMLHATGYFTPLDEFSLTGNFFYSFSEQPDNNSNVRQLVDLVATVKPTFLWEDLKFLLNLDWGGEDSTPAPGNYAQWWGFAGIVRQDFDLFSIGRKNWFVAVRGEYFDDVDGTRTGAIATTDGLQLWELTFTLGYRPLDNLLLRAEVRYDKADQNVFFHKSGDSNGDPNQSHQTTLALEAAFLF